MVSNLGVYPNSYFLTFKQLPNGEMACVFKSIAVMQFLSKVLFIYFLMNYYILKFQTCCSIYKCVMATFIMS